jgi:predicted dehydrogenase
MRFGGTPFTFMGEGEQAAWKLIREGRLGTVRVVYAEVNWGRIESWQPALAPFYDVGPLFDVAVYSLMLLTAIFGPVRRVSSFGRVVFPDRAAKHGEPFHITTPDFAATMLEFDGGLIGRMTTDFYVHNQNTNQRGIEFHGDLGSLTLSSWRDFNGAVRFTEFGKPFSVQGTSEMLARWIGLPYNEINFLCAGINHQAFYLTFRRGTE